MKRLSIPLWLVAGCLSMLFLPACGGGGGSDSSGSQASITYNGNTIQADITADNAEELTVGAYEGGELNSKINIIASLGGSEGPDGSSPTYMKLGETLMRTLREIDLNATNGEPRAAVTQATTLDGTCGGQASYVISVDDEKGSFTGALTFSNFCNEGETLNGKVAFSGSFDMVQDKFLAATFSFQALRLSGEEDFTVVGRITWTLTEGLDYTQSIDMVVQDNATGLRFWACDYVLTSSLVDAHAYVEVTVQGKYYHPLHGYVAFHTDAASPVRIAVDEDWPESGVLYYNGAFGNKARLTFFPTYAEIDLALDGDDVFDDGTLTYSP